MSMPRPTRGNVSTDRIEFMVVVNDWDSFMEIMVDIDGHFSAKCSDDYDCYLVDMPQDDYMEYWKKNKAIERG